MNWSATGAILLALAVILGAFGAHGLQDRLDDYSRGVYEKAVFYHFLHAMGILVVAILGRTSTFPETAVDTVCWFLLAGIVLLMWAVEAINAGGGAQFVIEATGIPAVIVQATQVLRSRGVVRRAPPSRGSDGLQTPPRRAR